MADFSRQRGVSSEVFRERWMREQLMRIARDVDPRTILDVGAGNRPYQLLCESLGLTYLSHDFEQYDGTGDSSALQCGSWQTSGHDLVCDILEIPDEFASSIVICTEVLEHVPDPVRALEKLSNLVLPGGLLIVTVPFMSFMHQSPYWFQAGLSPYWFEHWVPRFGLTLEKLVVAGDYVDFAGEEIDRVLRNLRLPRSIASRFGVAARGLLAQRCPASLRDSAGFGTYCVASAGSSPE